MRKAISHWVLMHEHPFSIVEEEGFNFIMRITNPQFEHITRKALKNDCMVINENEKRKLKALLKGMNKISLTTDLWKSGSQKIEYMVITGHFIDSNWKLHKRVLSFVHIPPPRRGVDIADELYKCIKEWGIENKVHSVTVDNVEYNDSCLRILLDNFSKTRKIVYGRKIFHVRCCAHILNLLVQEGLQEILQIIDNVRESIKFLNQSKMRLKTFAEIASQLQLKSRKLVIDCPTQ